MNTEIINYHNSLPLLLCLSLCPSIIDKKSTRKQQEKKIPEMMRRDENDDYIANAILRLSGKLEIFAQPSARADEKSTSKHQSLSHLLLALLLPSRELTILNPKP